MDAKRRRGRLPTVVAHVRSARLGGHLRSGVQRGLRVGERFTRRRRRDRQRDSPARALAPSALLGSSVAVRAIASAAPDDTATLDGLLDGARIATLALEEASGMWNPDTVATAARRDGGDLVVTGSKTNVADATTADVFVVACRIDDSTGLVLVPATVAGVSVRGARASTCCASSATSVSTTCAYPPMHYCRPGPSPHDRRRTRCAWRPACSWPNPSARSTASPPCSSNTPATDTRSDARSVAFRR